jgi:hypothetical protein
MARSFIDPSLVEMALPKGPGWEWNPGATFVTAFNNAQENKRANEKMAMEQQLSEILFPAKKAQAEFTIKQLAYESERMENSYKLLNEDTDERRRLLRESRSSGLSSGVGSATDANSTGPDGKYKSQYGFGLGMKTQTTPAARPKVSWKVVTPATPATPQPGP